ncbi:ABC transporter ATP-binding protein [Streptosporangium sp. NPDC051022]|uniref:ABC transporter ATP-binding protein n=1 Tax=Streptosporangium sp. NPDC051022 TaxID=3155752 RepID=UPI00342B7E24
MGRAIDAALRGSPDRAWQWLGGLGIGLLAGAVGSRNAVAKLGDIVEPLRETLMRRVVDAAVRRALRRSGASLTVTRHRDPAVTQLTAYTEQVRRLTGAALSAVLGSLLTVIAALIGLSTLTWFVALVAGVAAAVSMLLLWWQAKAVHTIQRKAVVAGEEISERLQTLVLGARDALASGAAPRLAAETCDAVDEQAALTRSLARAGAARGMVLAVGGYLPVVVLLVTAPFLVRSGRIELGGLVGAVTYLSAHLAPTLRSLSQNVISIGIPLSVTLSRLVSESHSHPPSETNPDLPPRRPGRTSTPLALKLDRLTYAYGERAAPIVKDLSALIAPGEHVAVVGPSGVGKSTLADLLVGLAAPRSGRIAFGIDRDFSMSHQEARRHIVFVPQEAYIFTATLRDNVKYLHPDATDQDIIAAMVAVGGESVLEAHGDGLDGVLNAVELPASERQLIALARALVTPASVVILDEATSALDAGSAARAEAAFRRVSRTLVVIAHSQASALRADRIMMMDGSETRFGTYEELYGSAPNH